MQPLNPSEINEKLQELSGIDSGVLNGTVLTFDKKDRKYIKTISADQVLSLAGSGNVDDSYITLVTTGDGSHTLAFPGAWVMKGDAFDPTKVQEIVFKYTKGYVVGIITTLGAIA